MAMGTGRFPHLCRKPLINQAPVFRGVAAEFTMSWRDAFVSFSALPELGPLLLARDPAWAFSRDGSRVLWANPAAGARTGDAGFSALWRRRWREGRSLQREIANLNRMLPEKGTLARLRLVDDPRAVPLACRCRRIKAGEERAILLVGLEGAATRPSLASLASFLSDDEVSAAILDETGRVVAVHGTEADEIIVSGEPHIEFSDSGRFRLYLVQRPPAEEAAAASAPIKESGLRTTSTAGEPGASESSPAPSEMSIQSTVQAGAAESTRLASVELTRPPEGEPPSEPAAPARVRAAPAPEPQAPPSAEGPAGKTKADAGEAPARSVMAGRVPRELTRTPVRFLWQTDAADRFLFVSPGLAQVVGRSAEIVGERWQDAAARLHLDPSERIARALAQRDTWSGHTAWWPIEGSNVRVPAELTALPVFANDHSFQGYRGFGVLRPAEALMPAAFEARFGTAQSPQPKPAEQLPPYEEAVATTPANVVPIRAHLERLVDTTRLSPQERNAFEEIAAALRERVLAPHAGEPAVGSPSPASSDAESEPDGPPAPDVADAPQPVPPLSASIADPQSPPEAAPERDDGRTPELANESLSEPAPRGPRVVLADGDAQRRLREMTAILDTATDGVVILDGGGIIECVNASAEALFGLDAQEMQGMAFVELLTPESRQSALDYLSGLKENGVASLLNEGREVEAEAGAGSIPLFITMGRISSDEGGRFCVVLRDVTHWKRSEAELVAARRAAEAASGQKSEFLARVSHEIRTPLNAIIGFAEVMIEERFGPVENERYREYLRDIRTSGEHVVSLVNDLLDISKIEAGKLDLTFVAVPLNELVRECIQLMQPQANRAHVVLRSSLSRDVPGIVADQRTMRQIVLNLLSNSVKFTGPGGQVIASTSLAETGEALLRVRDTGQGMSEEELARALEPFRQINTSALADRTGTGLGLPLTKALVEANRATLSIRSARGEGTVVTVTFPPTRVLSE
jgi:PAS domain S-box-containing protein